MAIEQEHEDLYPLTKENILIYLPGIDCKIFHFNAYNEFVTVLVSGKAPAKDCRELLLE